MGLLCEQYHGAFAFLSQKRALLGWMSAAFLLIAALCGGGAYLYFSAEPEAINTLMTSLTEVMMEGGGIDSEGRISAFGLFCNNLRVCLLALVCGVAPFLCLPALIMLINAAVLGVVVGALCVIAGGGYGLLYTLAGIIPHGIFELPALLMGIALGTALSIDIGLRLFGRPRPLTLLQLLSQLLRATVLVLAPMLAAAALIEAYITPLVLGLFAGF